MLQNGVAFKKPFFMERERKEVSSDEEESLSKSKKEKRIKRQQISSDEDENTEKGKKNNRNCKDDECLQDENDEPCLKREEHTCPSCGKIFFSKRLLDKHSCKRLFEKYSFKPKLKKHVATSDGQSIAGRHLVAMGDKDLQDMGVKKGARIDILKILKRSNEDSGSLLSSNTGPTSPLGFHGRTSTSNHTQFGQPVSHRERDSSSDSPAVMSTAPTTAAATLNPAFGPIPSSSPFSNNGQNRGSSSFQNRWAPGAPHQAGPSRPAGPVSLNDMGPGAPAYSVSPDSNEIFSRHSDSGQNRVSTIFPSDMPEPSEIIRSDNFENVNLSSSQDFSAYIRSADSFSFVNMTPGTAAITLNSACGPIPSSSLFSNNGQNRGSSSFQNRWAPGAPHQAGPSRPAGPVSLNNMGPRAPTFGLSVSSDSNEISSRQSDSGQNRDSSSFQNRLTPLHHAGAPTPPGPSSFSSRIPGAPLSPVSDPTPTQNHRTTAPHHAGPAGPSGQARSTSIVNRGSSNSSRAGHSSSSSSNVHSTSSSTDTIDFNSEERVNHLIQTAVKKLKCGFDIKAILEASRNGSTIWNNLQKDGYVNETARKAMSKILVNHTIKSGLEANPVMMREEIAVLIAFSFPKLRMHLRKRIDMPWHHWYNPSTNTGLLENANVGFQRAAKKLTGVGKRRSNKVPGTPRKLVELPTNRRDIEPDDPDTPEFTRDVTEARNLIGSEAEKLNIMHLMRKTFQRRRQELEFKELLDNFVLSRYPHFLSCAGEVIEQEFSMLYPESSTLFLRSFSIDFVPKIMKIASENPTKYEDKMNYFGDELLNAILVLSKLLPPPRRSYVHEARQPRTTNVADLIHMIPVGTDPQVEITKRRNEVNFPIQPYLMIKGNPKAMGQMFIVCGNGECFELHRQASPTNAIDLLFKTYWALHLHYPLGWKNVFRFLQIHVYDITTPNERESIFERTANTLRNTVL